MGQKPAPGRWEQVEGHLQTLTTAGSAFGAGSVALTGNTGFLTSKLVLAFFKTSCVLVTETTKQPPNAEFTHWGHPCPGCVFWGVSAWSSCCPHVPLHPHSRFLMAQLVQGHHASLPGSLAYSATLSIHSTVGHPDPPPHSRAQEHPHWLRMNCSRLSFCRVVLCRRSAVL